MFKFYRGCTLNEAIDLKIFFDDEGEYNQRQDICFFTDNFDAAAMYARQHKDATVVEVIMDELPRGIQQHFNVREGMNGALPIREWRIQRDYMIQQFSTSVEETNLHRV